VSDQEYDAILDQVRAADLAVVRRATGGDPESTSLIEIAIEPGGGPYAQFERSELRAELARALARLPERERHILALYYEQELTLAEVGQVIGVSESRVSQLRTQAIARLRSMMGEWLETTRKLAS
jgi:RNA polymerase sigma factor FliA